MRNSFDTVQGKITFSPYASALNFLSEDAMLRVPEFKQLIEYLASKTLTGTFPRRKDIRPYDLKSLLPDLYIFDVIWKDGVFVDLNARLLGTKISRYYGEHTGKSITVFENKAAIDRIFSCVSKVIDDYSRVSVEVTGKSLHQNLVRISVLYCPLVGEDQKINQIIGLLIPDS